MKVRRREFLQWTGVAAVGAGTAGVVRYALAPIEGVEYAAPAGGRELWKRTLCGICPEACGLQVRTVDGNAVKLEGNRAFPTNRGGVCPRGHAGLNVLYDPDRLRGPVRRAGARGEGKWAAIPWDEGIRAAATRLREIRQAGRPHGVVVVQGADPGLRAPLLRRFMEAYGSPNLLLHAPNACASDRAAFAQTQGFDSIPVPDWDRLQFLLSFGAAFLECGPHFATAQRGYADFRRGREGRRGMFVQVEPRLSITASKADRWIPIRPGAEGILALGIAHVLLCEGLYDASFVRDWTEGFEGWRDFVLRGFAPADVEVRTDVPAATIAELAREFGRNRPSIALPPLGAAAHTNSTLTAAAVHALNALVGTVRPGGELRRTLDPRFPGLPSLEPDAIAREGLRQPSIVPPKGPAGMLDALSDPPYPVEALVLLGADPLSDAVDRQQMEAALSRIPWILSLSPTVDDTSLHADLILPDHTPLERLDVVAVGSADGVALGLMEPAVAPVGDTRDAGETLLAVARESGGALARAMPWSGWPDFLKESVRIWYERSRTGPGFEPFWDALVREGVWSANGRPMEGTAFGTRSGLFEFVARYEPPAFSGSEDDYPLHLAPFRSLMQADGVAANSPWLLENYGFPISQQWDAWVEVNPRTARRLAIRDGDPVWVESARGRVRVWARLREGIHPAVVAMPLGLGHRAYGRWAAGRGADPLACVVPLADAESGAPAWSSTRVRMVKA